MPNRIIKESICTSDNLTCLDQRAQLFFLRLTVQCDDFGRFDARIPMLRATCYPMELDVVSEDLLATWLQALADADLLWLYTVDGKRYLQVTTWHKHQHKRAQFSKYPNPPEIADTREQVRADASNGTQVLTSASEESRNEKRESEESRGEKREAAAAPQGPFPSSSFLKTAICTYENTIGLISGATQTKEITMALADLESRHLEGWWDGALKIAADQNKRSWAYVQGIIHNCLREGKPPGSRGNGQSPGSQATDTQEYIRQQIALERKKEAASVTARGNAQSVG